MDCPPITVHAGKCYKALISLGAAISLLRYSAYKNIEDSYKTPIPPTTVKLNTADGSPMAALGMTALHLRIAEFKFTQFYNLWQATQYRIYFQHIYTEKNLYLLHLGQRKELLYTKGRGNSWHIWETVNRRQPLAQLNHHSKYHHNTMVLYQLKWVDQSLRNRWHISSQMTTQQRAETPT